MLNYLCPVNSYEEFQKTEGQFRTASVFLLYTLDLPY
jgi:hypothetical protein